MMSTQNQAEHAVIHSSIALLQERFKQLQRVKEMREKKELLRLFSDNYKINNTNTTTTTTITTTTTTASADPYNKFENPNSHNHHHHHHHHNNTTPTIINDVDDLHHDDELQIFLPPNYYCSNYNRTKPTSSLLSHNNNNSSSHNNYHNNFSEISLSLWPPAADNLRRGSFDAPLTTLSRAPSSCLTSAFKFEESHHVSDVDTTLHL